MTLPKVIQIGPIAFTVKEVQDLHTTDDDGRKKWLHGHILFADAEIKVASDQSDDVKVTTLWHEVIHGLLDQAGVDEHPESLVCLLGYGLVKVLRDNPDLVKATVGLPPLRAEDIRVAGQL